MGTVFLVIIVAVGLAFVVACGFWVMSGAAGGGFRNQAPNLNACPQCGAPLDPQLDHCPKCSLRTSV